MAAPPPRDHTDNRYDDAGGGGYGKFRRRPLRKPHSTPYDRPPAALRNAASPGGGGGRGWLSRLVDPAQRLITSSAHRLFASVFQKRLGPAPPTQPHPPETEPNLGARIERNEAVVSNETASKIQDSVNIRFENPSNISEGGGASELELMLKQQTFTRSEVDRLTTLLQSRLLDQPVGDQGNKTEMLMSSTTLSSKGKERLCTSPVRESEQDNNRLISSRYNVGRNLVPEEVSNPAELAKAYMGGGPSKLTPTKNCLLAPPLGENSPAPTPFPQKTPTSELVPSSNSQAVYTRNGFVTPRSLGRSAIYSMARTPYSRGVSGNTLQASATPFDSHGGPSSSSQDTWRNDRSSGLRQGTLKRRSSVFENDIAAVGPIRRIRQKSNLLPASGILSARGTGLGVLSSQKQSLKEKAVFTGEPSTRNGEDGNHGSGFNSVPSESSQMASKILQQLNTLVSTPAKSPSKLSPSMLRGPALRSMENIDSSKFLEVAQDGSRLAVQSDTSHPVPRDSISQKDTVENGPVKFFVPRKESASSVKDVGASDLQKSDMYDVKLKAISVPKRAPEDPDPMKRAFRMSAHEEVDEGDSPTAPPTFTLANGIEKSDADLVENKINASEKSEKLPTFELIQKTVGTSDGSGPEKSDGSMLSSAPFPWATIRQDMPDKQSTEALGKSFPLKDSGVGPSFSTRDSIASLKEPSGSFPIIKAADKVPSFSFTSSPSLTYNSSNATSESPSSSVPSHVMESVKKEPDSKSTTKDALSKPPENSCASTSSATPSFSFGVSAAGSSLSTGSLAPSPFSSSYGSSSVAAASLTVDATTSSSLPALVSAPSSTATPIFKFGTPPASSSSALSESLTAAPVSAEAKANGGSFNSMSNVSFSGTSTSFAGTGSSIFGSTPSAVSGPSGLFGGSSSTISSTVVSTPSNTSSGSAIVSFSSAASALPSNNQSQGFNPLTASTNHSSAPGTTVINSVESASVPYQFGSSAPSTSFGLAGNVGFSSGSSPVSSSASVNKLFGSSAPSASFGLAGNAGFSSGSSLVSSAASDNKLFGSSSIFGLPSSAPSSESNTLSSSSSATPSLFGSNWQTPNIAPISGSSNASPSVPYVFGTGTPSNSAASGTQVMFGSSTTASTGLPFSFSSPAITPVFGNPSSFGGSSPSGNNDQMSMEDSMAEDSIQATPPAAAVFGQQPIPNPSSGFTYGSGTPARNPFGSTAPGGANPFQFGGQPSMAAQPNPSPFQASGSLEFAGGSFSLGASGGGGGGDKSNRKIVKVRRTQRKR